MESETNLLRRRGDDGGGIDFLRGDFIGLFGVGFGFCDLGAARLLGRPPRPLRPRWRSGLEASL